MDNTSKTTALTPAQQLKADQRRPQAEVQYGRLAWKVARYTIAILLAITIMFPFYWMSVTSFKTVAETRQFPPTLIPQDAVGLENYEAVTTRIDFLAYLWNSVFVSTVTTFGALITSALAGYILAKFRFQGRNTLFLLIVATMMVPFHVILIPVFLIVKMLGIHNTLWALIIPGLVTPWGIFLMRQYMLTLPSEIMDAARVDGASEPGIFLRIILPIARPGLSAVGIFIFMYHWNDFLWPLVVIEDAPLRTLPLGLALFSEGFGIARWNVVMAAAVLTVVPILILFAVAQRNFIEGITLGSTKG
jgi:ABC-type glycerol-3-phosphate transport system permease component